MFEKNKSYSFTADQLRRLLVEFRIDIKEAEKEAIREGYHPENIIELSLLVTNIDLDILYDRIVHNKNIYNFWDKKPYISFEKISTFQKLNEKLRTEIKKKGFFYDDLDKLVE